MLKKIAIVAGIVIVGLLGFAATKPDDFRVQREVVIQAPPGDVFMLINDLHKWKQWSPWEKKDPEMKGTHSGDLTGVGAVYEWDGNMEVGKGRMEIIESISPAIIKIKMDFDKPLEGHSTAEFKFESQAGTTKVTWLMYGPTTYVGKVMNIFVDCEKMVGKEFEIGLANLKALAEK